MKCLPATKLPLAAGTALHDWHAEVLAIRAFNHLLLEDCRSLASGGTSSLVRLRTPQERSSSPLSSWEAQPFALRDNLTLHMYCSEAPCGDASMELTMADQPDASPWEVPVPPPVSDPSSAPQVLSGRAFFSRLAAVRRKPSRPDAPPTLSKSCSDKIALRQCVSLLLSPVSLVVHPANAYLAGVVLPESRFCETGWERCFSADGRMAPVAGGEWPGGYAFRGFGVRTTTSEFAFSRGQVARRSAEAGGKVAASNLAVAWTAGGLDEGLVGGVLQGRRQFDARGASRTSRRRMWALALAVVAGADGLGSEEVRGQLEGGTYGDVKDGVLLEGRRKLKDEVRRRALKGWVRNTGDEGFGLCIGDR